MMDSETNVAQESSKPSSKPPVVRGARACTVCRTAKMKCVGAEDGEKPCQRCKRANVECIFEKHRRGRKPGSKLSEASKMLRRLEKGLNSAKLKSQSSDTTRMSPYPASDTRGTSQSPHYSAMMRPTDNYTSSGSHFSSTELPPINPAYQPGHEYGESSTGSRTMEVDEDDEDYDRNDENLHPVKLIRKENQRSFFQTVLDETAPPCATTSGTSTMSDSYTPAPPLTPAVVDGLDDPISSGLLDEDQAKILFDLFFLRLNPFANIFDPALHSVAYVRSKCPFLFTTIIMVGCKFFRPEWFKQSQKMAHDFAVRAFAEYWRRVEVVQAFACLTYWKDPDENRTWVYIGYACRMAVELGLNRFVSRPPPQETEFQMRERRNRERTFLVLFVHDRSLSMQTGRSWMLPEDDLIRNSTNWHKEGGVSIRPEDVIVSGFVQLRRIAAETTDGVCSHRAGSGSSSSDVNYDGLLRNCNHRLAQWMEHWTREMKRAGGEKFHFSFLNFFRLHVRLFLNSYGIQGCMSPTSRANLNMPALSACYTSAVDSLKIVSKEFASMNILRYGQDSITVMTAYSAVFLLRLLRNPNILPQLHDGTPHEIQMLITQTADAYQDASALYHARFLRNLVGNDIFKTRRSEPERHDPVSIDPRLQSSTTGSPPSMYRQAGVQHESAPGYAFPASPNLPVHPAVHPTHSEYVGAGSSSSGGGGGGGGGNSSSHASASTSTAYQTAIYGGTTMVLPANSHASELDAHYWKNMLLELGYGDNPESGTVGHQEMKGVGSSPPPWHGGGGGVGNGGALGHHHPSHHHHQVGQSSGQMGYQHHQVHHMLGSTSQSGATYGP